MKMQYGKRQAVAPVLATLLMIAVAVAMSVIIFMWSQGFLSQTSSATGGQQGAQNQAAQSSIAIESATFTANGATAGHTIVVRNVGAVAVSVGSISVTGTSSNALFKGALIITIPAPPSTGAPTITPSDGSTWAITPASAAAWTSVTPNYQSVPKGSSVTIALSSANAATGASGTQLSSGDVVNVKITTTVGTFASAQFTVP